MVRCEWQDNTGRGASKQKGSGGIKEADTLEQQREGQCAEV